MSGCMYHNFFAICLLGQALRTSDLGLLLLDQIPGYWRYMVLSTFLLRPQGHIYLITDPEIFLIISCVDDLCEKWGKKKERRETTVARPDRSSLPRSSYAISRLLSLYLIIHR